MARRRFRRLAKRARSFGKKAYRGFRRSARSEGGVMNTLLAAGIYGAIREPAANAAAPLLNKIPFGGNLKDEAALGGAGYLLSRYGRYPLVKAVGRAAMTIEAARAAERLRSGAVSGIGEATSSSQGSTLS